MIDFTKGDRRFSCRVAGVMVRDGHVLLHTMDDADYWILPGGRAEFGETSIDGLRREMREELGQEVQVGRLLWIAESLLHLDKRLVQSIGLYFAISLPDPSQFFAPGETFESIDSGMRLTFAWHSLDRLDAISVYPPFLQQSLRALPEHTGHILDIRA